jgi:peptide/nickel transport system permease protein
VGSFMVRRLLQALIVVLGVTLIAFILQNLIASGPELARAIIGPKATRQQVSTFIAQYGLNHPVFVQYLHYLGQLLRGNLGYSYKLNEPVRQIIAAELPKDAFIVGESGKRSAGTKRSITSAPWWPSFSIRCPVTGSRCC